MPCIVETGATFQRQTEGTSMKKGLSSGWEVENGFDQVVNDSPRRQHRSVCPLAARYDCERVN